MESRTGRENGGKGYGMKHDSDANRCPLDARHSDYGTCDCPDCISARLIDRQRERIEEVTCALRGLIQAYNGHAGEWAQDPRVDAARAALKEGI